MDFGRLITAMVTPFDEQGNVNWTETAKLIDYLIEDQRSESLVVCGTTGESPTLTEEEKLKLFEFAVDHAKGRCKIIAGTGSNSTAHSIHLTQEAEKLGVDGVLLVVPYYNKPNQEGLYRHFEAIARSTKLPVMLYNVPGRTVVGLSTETTLRLAEIPNVVATKECASLEQVTQIAAGAPAHFRVYSGDDASGLPAMAVGAYGIVSVAGHIIGASMKDMITAYLEGEQVQAARLHQKLFPVFKGLFESPTPLPNPAAVKYALNLLGHSVGGVRLPLIGPNEKEAEFIERLVHSLAE
ncbi:MULTISPECIES: 4-hydroxy-tetrahydrodipicolinate synthase [Paenibacillus]|uniref:4-hydroxy-tetrahydrodipicolinate synthase n=1 Tax=Paenibacillus rhizosphaerae TaxID=297318 RepID=A0A1R1F301_9BACL|nr:MULTISPECIES: 4-hydroxy-tetrahydrodipicolinate synthase [Paenibacillus]OMF58415.1 4-hydroxy-tetrahydrodipicolinate synthase [Paenibacillus rhizosphaerae]OXL82852.1 4-hydroxy-tetrahydrodipicolinate synthase [Paenibacillus sp. SSG-1]GIO61095.1 4-hydroxy-tetrahydrodipicolinate synthase [Paenibacillus cineris]